MQQGRIIVTTLLQTWILLIATRSYHSYDLVADMDFAQCNKQSLYSSDLSRISDFLLSYKNVTLFIDV